MGNWRKRFSSPHLEAADLPNEGRGKATIKILSISTVELESDDGSKSKALITFQPSPAFAAICKKTTWAMAKTCGYQLDAAFGEGTDLDDKWIGKKVTLYAHRLRKSGEPCLRICGSPDIEKDVTIRVMEFGAGKVTFTIKAEKPPAPPPTDKPAPGTSTAPADAAQTGA